MACIQWGIVLTVAMTCRLVIGQTNLLQNPSFEDDLNGVWFSNGFQMERITTDVLHGHYSILCSSRDRDIDGPLQKNVEFIKGRHYVFEGYVKLLSDVSGKPWQIVKAAVQSTLPDNTVKSYNIAFRSFCSTSHGWIHLKGDIEAPQLDVTDTKLVLRGPDAGTDFLVDNLTFYEVPENPNWRKEADVNIETHRKSNVVISVNLPEGVPAAEVDVEIALKRHWFAFGSLLRDYMVNEEAYSELLKLAYYLFDWATIQSYKWKFNKGNPPDTNPDFSRAVDATNILLENGMKVRGHSVFWNVKKNVPDWVKALDTSNLRPALFRHLNYMINLGRGKLQHWDLQNEHIAGHYYEETLNDPGITKELHVYARSLNDSAALYMNEFQCITSGAQTEQYHDIAMEFLNEGIPLDGLGIQGHTKDFVRPGPTAMWRRIDRLAETGLQIMMTEFDLGWPDKIERADWFEDAIRAFYGHPAMSGVILWDFWNETIAADHELVEGLELNEVGQRWACLVKKEWTTNQTFNLGDTGNTISLRGFQGDYVITVRRNKSPVQKSWFSLRTKDKTVALDVTASTVPLNSPPAEHDYVPQCISHRAARSLGTGSTSATQSTLTCRTVFSSTSGTGENDTTSVSCDADELMTGCSSYHTKWTRNGEKLEMNPTTGKMQCTAYNGRDSTNGVKAYARCCKVAGLTCDYRTAGPSFPFDGAMAEASCSSGYLALGCSTYSAYPDSDGVRPDDTTSSCLGQSGAPAFTDPGQKSGVHVYSACCQASAGLECRVEKSTETALTSGKNKWVACPSGYVMTGCNAFADSGKAAGARVLLSNGIEKCKAYLGADLPSGSTGVTAYATCCKV
ncbi:uncharacterized protein LOC143297101 [Babylonia areolata]|uniref:uncharacterized protein LOC143297101 n=1 Tax=Babylonia areolata TaxID=304850 RepID=UPI003FD17BEA